LDNIIEQLRNKLKKNGLMFVSVPNRLTFFEKIGKVRHQWHLKRGGIDRSGIPHVNFMSYLEWKHFFKNKGLIVRQHDMAIGFFVNDVWHALFGIPSRIFVDPIIRDTAKLFGIRYNAHSFEKIFYPKWLMKLVNELDETTKRYLKNRWGWNLFVLSRSY
jgi:hypothetical protein